MEKKLHTDRPFDPDLCYSIVERITRLDLRPGLPGRSKYQQDVPGTQGSMTGQCKTESPPLPAQLMILSRSLK
jgi:hypothetical protein